MSRSIRGAIVLSAAALTLFAGVLPPANSSFGLAAQTASSTLVDLSDVAQLRTRFNADSEFTRLVLLVSPT